MKLGLITQIRNEIDIISTFLNHVDSLFDCVFIIDHQSIDGTEEVLKEAVDQRPTWKYYYLDVKTRLQAEVANLLLHQMFSEEIDYLFFLDADEFIHTESREKLEARLVNWKNHSTVGVLHWENCICDDLEENQFTKHTGIWIPENESLFTKIIISKELYENFGREIYVSQGNHSLFDSKGIEFRKSKIGTMIHVPIRSIHQAQSKAILGVIPYLGYSHQNKGNSYQYYEMVEKIAIGNTSDDDIRGFTIGFEKPGMNNTAISREELAKRHYTLTTFGEEKISIGNDLKLHIKEKHIPFTQKVALILNGLESDVPLNVPLVIENNRIMIDEAAKDFRTKRGVDNPHQQVQRSKHLVEQDQTVHSLISENVAYATSKSWQITRPLRKLAKFIRGKKNE